MDDNKSLQNIFKRLERSLGGMIDHGIEHDLGALTNAVYDILEYLIHKELNDEEF